MIGSRRKVDSILKLGTRVRVDDSKKLHSNLDIEDKMNPKHRRVFKLVPWSSKM